MRSGIRAQRSQADASLAAAERSISGFTTTAIRARAAIGQARRALAADAAAALDEPVRQLGTDAQYAGKIAAATPASEAARLTTAVGELAASADAITRRVRSLGGTVGTLAQGGDTLVDALDQLDGGADKLSSAVGAVGAGVDGLASGVRSGEQRSGELSSGLRDASSAVRGLSGSKGDAAGSPQPAKASASFFDSGYFLLAALESGNGDAPFGVNVDKGGQGARIVVVPRYPASDPRTQALYERLQSSAANLGRTLGAETAVGGPAAVLSDYDAASRGRLPLIVLMLTLVTALLLAVLLRSVVVAGIGVVLNLLAVGATLGLLRLLFQGDAPLLGGPGEIDAVAVTAIFGVVFALSIDYQVFIVSRVREEWLRTGDAAAAVQVGLARTARVVTGAALSMLGVFFAFGLADVASLRQFGVGLAIAVIIDATLVRLVLLPAALHLAGDWAWWKPKLGFDERPSRAGAQRAGLGGAGGPRLTAGLARLDGNWTFVRAAPRDPLDQMSSRRRPRRGLRRRSADRRDMHRFTPALALSLLTLAVMPTAIASAADPVLDAEEKAFCKQINQYRAQNGQPALRVSVSLTNASKWMSTDMASEELLQPHRQPRPQLLAPAGRVRLQVHLAQGREHRGRQRDRRRHLRPVEGLLGPQHEHAQLVVQGHRHRTCLQLRIHVQVVLDDGLRRLRRPHDPLLKPRRPTRIRRRSRREGAGQEPRNGLTRSPPPSPSPQLPPPAPRRRSPMRRGAASFSARRRSRSAAPTARPTGVRTPR